MNTYVNSARRAGANQVGLTDDAQKILSAINKFGCMVMQQLKYLLDDNSGKENKDVAIVTFLEKKKYIQRDGEYIYSNLFLNRDKEMINEYISSVWAMIKSWEKLEENVSFSEWINNSFKAERPETYVFISKKVKVVHLVPVSSKADITKLLLLQDKYFSVNSNNEGSESTTLFSLVCREKELIQEIGAARLKLPMNIIYLEGDVTAEPTEVRFFAPKK